MNLIWVIILLVLVGFVGLQNADASCAQNQDWSLAPCFDNGSPSKSKYVERWSPYYDYKGSELMERKKIEMIQSLENKTFDKWMTFSENPHENSNVYRYYLSMGVIANQFPHPEFVDEQEYVSPKKQQSLYTKPYALKCRIDLQPVILQSGNYACVKSETRDKLLELNLIHDDYSQVSIYLIGNNFQYGGVLRLVIINEGMVPIKFDSPVIKMNMYQSRDLTFYDEELLYPGFYADYKPWTKDQLSELDLGIHTVQIDYSSDIHKQAKKLEYEFDWKLEMKNKLSQTSGCRDVGGKWFGMHNECESTQMTETFENYCSDLDGEYDSCTSNCRHYPAGSDLICTSQCIAVCEFN